MSDEPVTTNTITSDGNDVFTETCTVCDADGVTHSFSFPRDETTSVNIELRVDLCSECITREDAVIDAVTTFADEHGADITPDAIRRELRTAEQ